jgi:microcystin-dependent protein
MANPTPYTVTYSFAGFQANNPTTPLPGSSVDNEFANAATAVASLRSAVMDIRRSDGALKNGIVTIDSLESGLALTIDPTNGDLVAAAVATSAANAALTDIDRIAAAASAAAAALSAAAAEASASTVNLTLYLAKANNLAGLGSTATSRSNLGVPSLTGAELTGRLATVTGVSVTDWNDADENGWYFATGAANGPTSNGWLVHVMAYAASYVAQTAHLIASASFGVPSVEIYRRYSYDVAGVRTWLPWESASPVPVGEVSLFPFISPPVGWLKANGALVSRVTYPRLYAAAAASGNILAEAAWTANAGGFSTGDLSTTFRLPDLRGEFIRGFDDARGIDSGRTIGSTQADALKSHTHDTATGATILVTSSGAASVLQPGGASSGPPSTGAATETRPRNVALLACIKY